MTVQEIKFVQVKTALGLQGYLWIDGALVRLEDLAKKEMLVAVRNQVQKILILDLLDLVEV